MFNRTKEPKTDEKEERIRKLEERQDKTDKIIAELIGPKYRDMTDREQRNRDGLHDVRTWCRDNDRKNMNLQKEMDQGDEALGKRINILRAMIVNEYAKKAKPGPAKPKETESQGLGYLRTLRGSEHIFP